VNEIEPGGDALLERAAIRAADGEGFLASVFRVWCGGPLDLAAVAETLSCARAAVVRAALCRRPRAESFRTDVSAIATTTAIDEAALAGLLREAASLEAFRKSAGQQILAAARDAPDDGEEPNK
jgi:DNA topoisomerase IB